MIDMHCHIDLYPDPHNIIEQCKNKGLYVLSVTTTPKAWRGTNALAAGYNRIRTALGLHPQLANERYGELEIFDALLGDTKYVGEIGLDGSKNYQPYYKQQLDVFRHILNSVQQSGGRIMTIHSRGSASVVLDELSHYPDAGVPILHWFSGSKAELRRAIAMGCWFSVGPAMLKSNSGMALAKEIPIDRLLPETDGPFATINNSKLMPWDVNLILKPLSMLWNQDEKSVESTLFANFRQLLTYS